MNSIATRPNSILPGGCRTSRTLVLCWQRWTWFRPSGLNAGAGVGRLGGYTYGRRDVVEQLVTPRPIQKLTLTLVVAFLAGQAISHSVGQL